MINIKTISEIPNLSAISEEIGKANRKSDSFVRNEGKATSIEHLDSENGFLREGRTRGPTLSRACVQGSDDSGNDLVFLAPRTAKNAPPCRWRWLLQVLGWRS